MSEAKSPIDKPYTLLSIYQYGPATADEKLAHHLLRFRSSLNEAEAISATLGTDLLALSDESTYKTSLKTVKKGYSGREKSIQKAFVDVSKMLSLIRQEAHLNTRRLPEHEQIPSGTASTLPGSSTKASELSYTLNAESELQSSLRALDEAVHALIDDSSSIESVQEAKKRVDETMKGTMDGLISLSRPGWMSDGTWARWSEVLRSMAAVKHKASAEWSQFSDGI